MYMCPDMVVNIQEEVKQDFDDLEIFDRYFLKQLKDNLKRPGFQINVGDNIVATPVFKFGANLQIILEIASNLVQFYKAVGRAITNIMTQWDPNINDFKQECKIFLKRKGEDIADVLNISKVLLVIKWTEYFSNFLYWTAGEKKVPM